MNIISHTPRFGLRPALRNVVAVLALTGFSIGGASAAAPLAGTTIGNQASATYSDASLVARSATSNTVTTIVQQVAAFALTSGQTKSSAPGAPISFAHTVVNNGNGTDSFSLTAATVGGAIVTGAQYFIDVNCDGVADNATVITAVNGVAPGASACFVSTATVVPTGSTTGTMTIVATSALVGGVFAAQTNIDTINVTTQAVINVTKAISVASGLAGTSPVTYTLTYTNTGNTAATNVILSDVLPVGMTYLGTPLLNGVAVTLDPLAPVGSVAVIVPTVTSGQSGTFSFQVSVGAAVAPGTLANTARYCYNDGAAVQPVAACTTSVSASTAGTPTNTANFTVLQIAAYNFRTAHYTPP